MFQFTDRTNPMDKHMEVMMNGHGLEKGPVTAQMFGNAGREHMEKYGKNQTVTVHYSPVKVDINSREIFFS